MLPDFDLDSRFTRAEIAGFTVILVLATMLPFIDRAGVWYSVGVSLGRSVPVLSCGQTYGVRLKSAGKSRPSCARSCIFAVVTRGSWCSGSRKV